jgi:hypothetical protein
MRLCVVITLLLLFGLLAGCGGEEGREQQPPSENEEAAEQTTTAGTTAAMETTANETADRRPVLRCEDFVSQELAQNHYRGRYALEAEKEVMDADGNGTACDEPGNEVGSASADAPDSEDQYDVSAQRTPEEQELIELGACQTAEARVELGPERYAAVREEFLARVDAADPDDAPTIQEFLAERGYTCDGKADEVLNR